MKLDISRQIFEKHWNIRFQKIRPVEAELVHAGGRAGGRAGGQMDGQPSWN